MAHHQSHRSPFLSSSKSQSDQRSQDASLKVSDDELEALLQHIDNDDVVEHGEMDLSQLEKFFRICASALAAKSRKANASRATTFTMNAQSRSSTMDIKGEVAHMVAQSLSVNEDRAAVEKAYEKNAEQLLLEQTQEWTEKRTEWRQVLDTVEDIWQFYFPDCEHGRAYKDAHALVGCCHPLSNPVLRRKTQEDLVLARLCLEHDSSNVRDAARFMPWLSLIGFKIEKLHTMTFSFAETFGASQAGHCSYGDRANILVASLRYFYEGPFHYLSRHDEFHISDMLDFCYLRGVLPRADDPTDAVLAGNFQSLVYGLWCLNILQTPRYLMTSSYPWTAAQQRLPVLGYHFLGLQARTAITESLGGIERRLQEAAADLPQATGEIVFCKDLSIQALRKIGGLKIVWTMCDRDHLFLDLNNGSLRISWFSRSLVPEFFKFMPMLGRNDVNHTWELLLGHRKHQHDYTELDNITLPPELKAYNQVCARKWPLPWLRKPDLGQRLQLRPKDVPDLFDKYGSLPGLPHSVPFSYFGKYEARVRILRHYMDTRKPTGIKNLWHDRRDSLTYYTFWAVLIFGGTSVLLAAMGLVVGILQAYASLKALDQ